MSEATDHDQLMKTVLREFFPEFLILFFPEQAAKFDLPAVTWLDKELFPAPPDGPKHILDLVAELRHTTGDLTVALIHIEIESAASATPIESRLPEYYFHLRRATGRPVLPVVVFLKVGLDGIGIRSISDMWDGEPVLTLRYRYVGLPSLPAVDYLRGDNWLGVALSALMRVPKGQRVALGVEAIDRLARSPLSDGKKALLGDCVETYIELPEVELARFRDIIEENATGRVQPVNKTRVQIAHEKGVEEGKEIGKEIGKEQGREIGIEEGLLRGLRAAVSELLEARFGPVAEDVVARVTTEANTETLRHWLRAASTAESLVVFRTAVGW